MQGGNVMKFQRGKSNWVPDLNTMTKQEIISYLKSMSPEQLKALDWKIGSTLINRAINNTADLADWVQNGQAPEATKTKKKIFWIFWKTG